MIDALHNSLIAPGLTVATAESCTSGLVASALTELSGSSAYYLGGCNTYSNRAKIDLLAVEEEKIIQYGAVSEIVAQQMALGARRILKSAMAISLTGIAGPGGGSEEKPVGTVWLALASDSGVSSKLIRGAGSRSEIRMHAVRTALDYLYEHVCR